MTSTWSRSTRPSQRRSCRRTKTLASTSTASTSMAARSLWVTLGMTGARLQNTMLNSLKWHDKSTGLITMCVGGGQGMAMIMERLS
ncbi:MAG: hypothetical protein R2709_07145 [Marmoricola sp.]